MIDIYRSVFPFVLLQATALVILMIFPEIILWLPHLVWADAELIGDGGLVEPHNQAA